MVFASLPRRFTCVVCSCAFCWFCVCVSRFFQLLVEYLLSRQLDEAAACVKELDCKLFHNEIVKRAVKVKS